MGRLRDKVKATTAKDSDRPPPKQQPLAEAPQPDPPQIQKTTAGRIAPPPETPSSVSPITRMIEAADIEEVSAPIPKAPKPLLKDMARDDLLAYARQECSRAGVSTFDQLFDCKPLGDLCKEISRRGLSEVLFSSASLPPPRRSERPTTAEPVHRPPPVPPRASKLPPPPPSFRAGSDKVTGEEATVSASDQLLLKTSRIAKFLTELFDDTKLNAEQRLSKAAQRLKEENEIINARFGNDGKKRESYFKAARERKGAKLPLDPDEQYAIDFDKLVEEVKELKKKVDNERQFQRDLEERRASQMPHSTRPPPSRKSRSTAPPPPAQEEAPKQASTPVDKPAEKEQKPAEKPAIPAQSRRSTFFTSPMLWTGLGMGAFSFAMFERYFHATTGFEDMAAVIGSGLERIPRAASYIRTVWETWVHLPPLDSARGSAYLYYGLSALLVGMGALRTLSKRSKLKKELNFRNRLGNEYREKFDYAVERLYEAVEVKTEGSLYSRLNDALTSDLRLFQNVEYFFKDSRAFSALMKACRMPDVHARKFDHILGEAEFNILLKSTEKYVEVWKNPDHRISVLKDLCNDSFFARKMEEMFDKTDWLYPDKKNKFIQRLKKTHAEMSIKIVEELEKDFVSITKK